MHLPENHSSALGATQGRRPEVEVQKRIQAEERDKYSTLDTITAFVLVRSSITDQAVQGPVEGV